MSQRLLEDGAARRLLEDGASVRLLEDGASAAPFKPKDWPAAPRTAAPPQGQPPAGSLALAQAGLTSLPFDRRAAPGPAGQPARRSGDTPASNLALAQAGLTSLPFGRPAVPAPTAAARRVQDAASPNTLNTLLSPPAVAAPFAPFDWSTPQRPRPRPVDIQVNNIALLQAGLTSLPFERFDWDRRRGRARVPAVYMPPDHNWLIPQGGGPVMSQQRLATPIASPGRMMVR